MDRNEIEEMYVDVLQNMEAGIVLVYRGNPDLVDWDALRAIEILIREYQSELIGRVAPQVALKPFTMSVYESVKSMCEMRLGRQKLVSNKLKSFPKPLSKKKVELQMPSKSIEEIVLCLKHVRRSIEYWNKEGGQRGYLDFVSRFIP